MKHNLDMIGERVAIYNPVIVARLQKSLCGMEGADKWRKKGC